MKRITLLMTILMLSAFMYAGTCTEIFHSSPTKPPSEASSITAAFEFNHVSEFDVQFINQTVFEGPSPSFNWSFGDGTGSSAADPLHSYSNDCFGGSCRVLLEACPSDDFNDTACSTDSQLVPIPG